jgi:hypothetical protein
METVVHKFKQANLQLIITNESFPDSITDVTVFESTEYTHSSWNEYIFLPERKPYQKHLELLKEAIIELGWFGKSGGEIANEWYFYFSDGVNIVFTWRSWAELMSAVVGRGESYIEYYF